MTVAKTNEATIAYDDIGRGPAVILLHGLGLDRSMWWPQVENLSNHYRVIAVDLRGAGGSSPLRQSQGVLSTQAEDINVLLEQLEIERAVICGISYGGLVAQEIALRRPEKISGLLLCDSFADMRLSSQGNTLRLRLGACLAVPMLAAPRLSLPAVRRIYSRWPHAREAIVNGYKTMRKLETIRMRRAANHVDNLARLSTIRCPTRGLVGDGSPQLIELMQRAVQAAGSQDLQILADSFDPSNLCQPEAVNASIVDFLRFVESS